MKKFGALEDEWQIKDSIRKTRHMQYSLVFSLYTIDHVKKSSHTQIIKKTKYDIKIF